MQTQDSESPYVTRDELGARLAELELRIVERIAALERRMDARFSTIEQRMNEHFHTQMRWMIGLILGTYALVIGTLVAIVLFSLNILARLPPMPSPPS